MKKSMVYLVTAPEKTAKPENNQKRKFKEIESFNKTTSEEYADDFASMLDIETRRIQNIE